MIENNRSEVLWDVKFQTEKQLLTNQADILVIDKEQKMVVVIDQNKRTQENRPGPEGTIGAESEGKVSKVPKRSRHNIRGLCPEEHCPRKS